MFLVQAFSFIIHKWDGNVILIELKLHNWDTAFAEPSVLLLGNELPLTRCTLSKFVGSSALKIPFA